MAKDDIVLLYGIDGFSKEVCFTEARETKKMYIVDLCVNWLGFRTRIPKDDRRVFLSPDAAIQTYATNLTASLRWREKQAADLRAALKKFKDLHGLED